MAQPKLLLEGKYEILGKIRDGGMGTIYKVRHRLLDEIRVIKVLQPHVVADEEMKRRFTEEARTATRLKHPNICTIHDFALDDDGTAYLVMEFIDGVNLSEMLKSTGRPGLSMALEIAHQALLALAYLHRKDVIHRDIAPDNLMLTNDDEGRPLVKLIDLGIAKVKSRTLELTATGVFLGKLKYASPEQYGTLPSGEKIDGRSDLYCLGIVLYELLTGTRPFSGDSAPELLKAHLFQPPLAFSESDPEGKVPSEVRSAILKALEKKREDRYGSADEFDREILTLRSRLARPDDVENTLAMISTIRGTGPHLIDTVTPSAQDRVDRQFAAQATPHPSRSNVSGIPAPVPGSRAPAGGEPSEKDVTVASVRETRPAPVHAPSVRARRGGRWVFVAALAFLAAVLVWQKQTARPAPPPLSPAATPAPSSVEPQATALAASPLPAANEPAAEPTPVPEENVQPTAAPEAPRLRQAAEASRAAAVRARQNASAARAPELAAGLFETAARRQREGERLLREQDFKGSQAAFEDAATGFRDSDSWARSHPPPRPSPAESVAALAQPTALPLPSPMPPTPHAAPTVEAVKPPAAAATEPARPVSDQDRIREVLHDYERAQDTLDLDLYARVYPALTGTQRQSVERAWQGLAKQQVELEIRQIDVKGPHAVVRAFQRLSATPRIGSEQRDARERTFTLEKRGDSWVIARID